MAPSDGPRCKTWTMRIVLTLLCIFHGCQSAEIAKELYVMNKPIDCISSGRIDVQRGKTTIIQGRSEIPNPQRSCTLSFGPQTKGDTLKMWFETGAYIKDCNVILTVQMTDNRDVSSSEGLSQYQMPCRTISDPPKMEAQDGVLNIGVERTSIGEKNYSFKIWVRAERSVAGGGVNGQSSGLGVGAIVGIVAGVIVVITLFCVLCVCCFLKSRRADRVKGNSSHPVPVQTYENKAVHNGTNAHTAEESPSSDRRLLTRNENDDSLRSKTALERFGPVPTRRPKKSIDNYSDVDVETGRKEKPQEEWNRQEENNQRRSPLLSDLHKNPKFRRSFHETEVDADDRVNRVSYTSENSTGSVNSRGVALPPKLPPVPKSPPRSPSPQRRGEKIAMISRDRPLSSSSDLPRQLDGSSDEASEDEKKKKKKADTRHTLRPDRGQRKSRRDEEDDSEDERRRRRKEKERKERERREEEEAEERRRKKKRERRREEEEDDERERRNRDKDTDDGRSEYEGRFKKSASGRKSKGKTPRKGRSRSTGNALDEMENNYQRSRSKSPSSVRSLNFIEDDDDDDLDSSYAPFKRSNSKTSLYASRSSLYGRRRKGSSSIGETMSMSTYAFDDADSRFGDFDKRGLSHREKERDRLFKSTGELEMHMATAQVVRECSTQTGLEKAVQIYGRKTIAKSRPGRMYSRGSQTGARRERRDSAGSARSGRSSKSRLKHKSRSQESLRKVGRSRSRNLDESDDSDDRRSRKSRSRSRNLDLSDDEDVDSRRGGRRKHHRSKSRGLEDDDDDRYSSKGGGRGKPKARPRKSTGAASVDLSESDGRSEGGRSAAPSSIAASMAHQPPHPQPNPYGAQQFVPVPMTFLHTAPGGPPMIPVMPQAGVKPPLAPKPAVAPKPQKSKWDTLVEMTEGEKQRRRWDGDTETESVMSSAFGNSAVEGPHRGLVYAPPSYTTAQRYPNPNVTLSSNYPDSSGLPRSARGPREYKLDSSYQPSESII